VHEALSYFPYEALGAEAAGACPEALGEREGGAHLKLQDLKLQDLQLQDLKLQACARPEAASVVRGLKLLVHAVLSY